MNIWPAARTTWIFFKHNEVLTLFNHKTKRFLFKIKLNSTFFLQIWLTWNLAGGVSQPLWALQVSGFYQVYMNKNYNLEDISLCRQKKNEWPRANAWWCRHSAGGPSDGEETFIHTHNANCVHAPFLFHVGLTTVSREMEKLVHAGKPPASSPRLTSRHLVETCCAVKCAPTDLTVSDGSAVRARCFFNSRLMCDTTCSAPHLDCESCWM